MDIHAPVIANATEAALVLDDVTQATQTKFVGIATITVLLWDHVDTFNTEVEFIWQRPKNLVSYLFLLNRYVTPLGFGVNIFAYFSMVWTPELCQRFIRFEGSMTLIGINVVAIMMLIRVRILYFRQVWVPRAVACVLAVQFAMNAFLLTHGVAVEHQPHSGVRSCTMIFEPGLSDLASTSAWLPLLYDSIVFGLTLYKTYHTIPWNRKRRRGMLASSQFITRKLLEDGILYFSVIMAVNLCLTLMIIAAPPGLKNITAQLQLIITVTMMSRITLRLKSNRAREGVTTDATSMPTTHQTSHSRSHGGGISAASRALRSAQASQSMDHKAPPVPVNIPLATRQGDTWVNPSAEPPRAEEWARESAADRDHHWAPNSMAVEHPYRMAS